MIQVIEFINLLPSNCATSNIFFFIETLTEWPVYMERGQYSQRKTNGDINIIQLGSNVTSYTIILEVYNFKDNKLHLKRVGQKLKAIFSMNVHCFTGCAQKSDYTLLTNQYNEFDLPTDAMKRMEDISLKGLHRGIVRKR